MGKKQKRGKAGNAVQYMTRNQAIKKLQLRLSEFRCAGTAAAAAAPAAKVQNGPTAQHAAT